MKNDRNMLTALSNTFKSVFTMFGKSPQARSYTDHRETPIVHEYWNGEKNFGELGSVSNYYIDYTTLALRSWQAYLESDLAVIIINTLIEWQLGTGLKLELQPKLSVLNSEGVNIDKKALREFAQLAEDRFVIHSESRQSTYSRTMNLHELAKEALKTAYLSGDALCVIREYAKESSNMEIVDGRRVVSPVATKLHQSATNRGNMIVNGIEMSPRGTHVAYFVQSKINPLEIVRIPAQSSKTKRTQAFMIYGTRYRMDYNRGLPLFSPILETLKKLDRYKEATVGSAEERAKIVYQIVHQDYSTGESPLLKKMQNALSLNDRGINEDMTTDYNSFDETAQKIATTSEKETYNMPIGSELKSLESKQELYFEELFKGLTNLVFAAMKIPPEVAMKVYNSNYSASRMAIKTYEHSLIVDRYSFAFQYYRPFFNHWLDMQFIKGKLTAPQYLDALLVHKNHMILESYRKSRWLGAKVPSVDPLKDVKAIREILGTNAADIPLSSLEQIAEELGLGDIHENLERFKEEVQSYLEDNPFPEKTQTAQQNL